MNVWAKPEPGIETNGELKPVAIAFESIVLPVPGAPRKSSPRSRLPPARSNASPDCQSVTTRRTSSLASTWPRTSASLTPHCASPGSKPRICEMPISSIGPMRIAKLAMNRKVTKTIWVRTAGFENADPSPLTMSTPVPSQEPPRTSQTVVITAPTSAASRAFFRQYQAPPADHVLVAQLLAVGAEQAGPRDQPAKEEVGEAAEHDHDADRRGERPECAPTVVLLEPDEEGRARQRRDDGRGAREAAPLVGQFGGNGSLGSANPARVCSAVAIHGI
jgi:hypothetical protein